MLNESERNLLLISAHADDELPSAGTIMKLRDDFGMVPYQAILTDSAKGPDFRANGATDPKSVSVIRDHEQFLAAAILGIKETFTFHQPDFRLENFPDFSIGVARLIQDLRPGVVIMNGEFDQHPDHIAAHQIGVDAVVRASMDVPSEGLVKKFRVPTVMGAEMMLPDRVHVQVDVTTYREELAELYDIYQSQMSPRLEDCLKGLGAARGYLLNGSERSRAVAEGFTLIPRFPSLMFESKKGRSRIRGGLSSNVFGHL